MAAPRQTLCRRPQRTSRGRDTYDCLEDITNIVNGAISYGDGSNTQHIDGCWVTVADSGLAATPFTVNHTLARVPVGFHVMRKTSTGDIFDSGVAWTAKTISLISPTAHVLNIKLFIF